MIKKFSTLSKALQNNSQSQPLIPYKYKNKYLEINDVLHDSLLN